MRPVTTPSEPLSALPALDGAALVGALVLVGTSVWLTLRVLRWLGRRSRQRRAARAQRAERSAAALLTARGFEVLGRQVRQSWALSVDGQELPFTLVADYLVERAGQRWVAEVKTGERSLDLRHGPTRRQLLEYREAFDAHGVLLVDAEGQTLQSVSFRRSPLRRRGGLPVAFAVGLIAGCLLVECWPSPVAHQGQAGSQPLVVRSVQRVQDGQAHSE